MKIHLVRHANAGRRTVGNSDSDRPLDDQGIQQAQAIAAALSSNETKLVLSSFALRCQQTAAPVAADAGLSVEITAALSEGQGGRPALALVRRLATSDASSILVSHGDIIPALLDLLAAAGTAIGGNGCANGNGCAKGSIWSLTVIEGRVIDARYNANP